MCDIKNANNPYVKVWFYNPLKYLKFLYKIKQWLHSRHVYIKRIMQYCRTKYLS